VLINQKMRFSRTLVLIVSGFTLVGCASLEKGVPGVTRYLQYVIEGQVVWEHAVGAGSASCETNATLNNQAQAREQVKASGQYVCASQPAPDSVLPFGYISSYERVEPWGLDYTAPMATRFNNSAACWQSIALLKQNDRVLKREYCGPQVPPKIRPGERTAEASI
jgi:hypothetical protein